MAAEIANSEAVDPVCGDANVDPGAERFVWNPNSVIRDMHQTVSPRTALTLGNDLLANAGGLPPGSTAGSAGWTAVHELARIMKFAESGREFETRCGKTLAVPLPPDGSALGGGPCFRCTTSGTTGPPKTIRRSHRSWIASFRVNQRVWNIASTDAYAVLGDLSNSLPLYASLEAMQLGADLHILSGPRPGQQAQEIASRRVTVIYATPTQICLLARASIGRQASPLGSVRLALVGGAKLDSATIAAARRVMPNAAVHEFYGSAETSFITLSDERTPPDSVGRAYPGVELKIEHPFLANGFGLVRVRSPYLSQGLVGQGRDADPTADGFMSPGEIGRLDADGYLYLAGRMDRVVTIGGRNVCPEVVESYLCGLEGVDAAVVLPQADPLRGSRFIAFVKTESPEVDVFELGRRCRAGLGPLIAPAEILRRDDWPMRPSGKTDFAALAADLESNRN